MGPTCGRGPRGPGCVDRDLAPGIAYAVRFVFVADLQKKFCRAVIVFTTRFPHVQASEQVRKSENEKRRRSNNEQDQEDGRSHTGVDDGENQPSRRRLRTAVQVTTASLSEEKNTHEEDQRSQTGRPDGEDQPSRRQGRSGTEVAPIKPVGRFAPVCADRL